jgi:hypothetical protein
LFHSDNLLETKHFALKLFGLEVKQLKSLYARKTKPLCPFFFNPAANFFEVL